MACHDPEGWNVFSRLRAFDTTPCFEEGIVFSSLLGALLLIGLVRSFSNLLQHPNHLTSRSEWLLRAKFVRFSSLFTNSLSSET